MQKNKQQLLDDDISKSVELYQQGNIKKALEITKKSLEQNTDNITLLSNAGAFSLILGNTEDAKNYLQKTLQIMPNNYSAHNNLALLFVEQKLFNKAQQHYESALKINPDYFDAHNNFAIMLVEQNFFEKAEKHYKSALKLKPNSVNINYNLGNLIKKNQRFDEAEKYYKTVLAIDPTHADTYNNLGCLLDEKKQFNLAEECYENAIKFNKNHISAQWNLAILLLRLGNFQKGFQLYEARYHSAKKNLRSKPPSIATPQYKGQDLTNKSILVYPEQGFGDEIQFIRYISLLKTKKGVKEIMLVCKPELKELFTNIDAIDHLLNTEEFNRATINGLDYWVFIMSLPLYFNTTLINIPDKLPYLYSTTEQKNKWLKYLPQNKFKIGLIWKGNANHKNNEHRSIKSLTTLQPLWQVNNNIVFISLQKGEGESEAQNLSAQQPIIDLGSKINNFADSAAIVSQLNLVICVDTAIAHLAGSLNIPCFVLLPAHDTDFRWLLTRDDSPWYPNIMQLFRQKQDGNWDEVIKRVVHILTKKYDSYS